MMKKLALSIIFILGLFNIAIAAEDKQSTSEVLEDVKALVEKVSLADVLSQDCKRIFRNVQKSQLEEAYSCLKSQFRPDKLSRMPDYNLLSSNPNMVDLQCRIYSSSTLYSVPEKIIDQAYSDYKSSLDKLKIKIEFTIYEHPAILQLMHLSNPNQVIIHKILDGLWCFKTKGVLKENKTISKYIEVNAKDFLQNMEYCMLFSLYTSQDICNHNGKAPDETAQNIKKAMNASNQQITISIVLRKNKYLITVRPGYVNLYETNRDQIITDLTSKPNTHPNPPFEH